jgi:hypothetical protein
MELHEALSQISAIREHVARAETFRGYRSAIVGFSSVACLAAAMVQSLWIPHPQQTPGRWLMLWVATAAMCLATVGCEMVWRRRRGAASHEARLTRLAVEQFLPCVVAGGLLTAVLARVAPESLSLLPGLWAVLFGLGVFASCRLLPRATFWIGAYYLFAGSAVLALGQGTLAFSPWLMVGSFGVGQALTAAVLYWNLERKHG